MQVIVKVIHVEEMTIKNKAVARVIMIAGTETITATLWNNEVMKNTHKQAQRAIDIGELVVTELNAELFNGKLQYGFAYGPSFVSLHDFAMQHALKEKSTKKKASL